MTHRTKTAFTLIELLVIIALITLLLGALQPAFDRGNGGSGAAVCLNNQRAIGQAAYMYAADHSDFLPRGIMRFLGSEYNIFVTALLPYTGFEGDPLSLWDETSGRPSRWKQVLIRRALRQDGVGDVWQCPDFPDEAHDPNRIGDPKYERSGLPIDTSLLDYVASTFPIPYEDSNIRRDLRGNRPPDDDAQWSGDSAGYHGMSRLADIEAWKNPAETIYVSEAHVQMSWSEFAFHHTFLMSQIPFGIFPRIANDRRHPAGINAMFFDGHARAMPLHVMDRGWPHSIGDRLRWFTFIPPELR